MADLNLHDLINAPYGAAAKAIKEAGLWDDMGGQETRKYTVRVEVQYIETDYETVTVTARSEDEAMELAESEYAGEDVVSVEAVKVSPAPPAPETH